MIGSRNTIEPNLDFSPVLATQPGGHCQVPHWGYVVEGSMTIRYQDGTEEPVSAGDLFHMQPGHTAVTGPNGAVTVDFSPTTPMTAPVRGDPRRRRRVSDRPRPVCSGRGPGVGGRRTS